MKIEDFDIINPSLSHVKQSDGKIIISTCTGSMWGKGNTCENVLLCQPLLTKAVVELTVELTPQFNAEQAGLVFFIDYDNYIKFVREMVNEKQVVVLAREIEGKPDAVLVSDFESSRLEIKIEIDDTILAVKWKSPESKDYTPKEFENWLAINSEFKVGMLVHGNNTNNQAIFSSLKINGQTQ